MQRHFYTMLESLSVASGRYLMTPKQSRLFRLCATSATVNYFNPLQRFPRAHLPFRFATL